LTAGLFSRRTTLCYENGPRLLFLPEFPYKIPFEPEGTAQTKGNPNPDPFQMQKSQLKGLVSLSGQEVL
jgi:hypothetical protein